MAETEKRQLAQLAFFALRCLAWSFISLIAAEPLDVDARLRLLLPEQYRERLDDVRPTSMGSAGLRYDLAGKVAWDQIWGSFCELALAGGPPHRGSLLTGASPAEVAAHPEAYARVAEEICRGLHLVTGLYAEPADSGWLRLFCTGAGMVNWLKRAITAENIAVRSAGLALLLPCGADFRVEKEVKNVITSVAKTCHYWLEHMDDETRDAIGQTLAAMDRVQPLLEPGPASEDSSMDAGELFLLTGLRATGEQKGWLAVECGSVAAAVWLMRLLIVSNVLARREGSRVLLPAAAARLPGAGSLIQVAEYLQRPAPMVHSSQGDPCPQPLCART